MRRREAVVGMVGMVGMVEMVEMVVECVYGCQVLGKIPMREV